MDKKDGEKTPGAITRRDALKRMKLAAMAAAAAVLQGVALPRGTDAQTYSEYAVGYANHGNYNREAPHDQYSKTDIYKDNYPAYQKKN